MVLTCPTCDCTKIVVDYDSQSMCCTECGLLFDITTALGSETIEITTESTDNSNNSSTTTKLANQSSCTSVPRLFKARYVQEIDLFRAHFDITKEETEFVMKLCRYYLYHPLHIYCRCPMEVTLCLYYLIVLQHRDFGARLLSDYCQEFDADPRRCLRIYTAMRLILADQLASAPLWYDPVHHLENIMAFVYPSLFSSDKTCFFSLHMDIKKKRKRQQQHQRELDPTRATWPPSMRPRTVRSQTIQLIDLVKQHGFFDGRHQRPLTLICLVITLLAHYYHHNPHVLTDINIHWKALATGCSFHDGHRTLQKHYNEILQFIHNFATSLPWLKHVEKKRDILIHLDDILSLRTCIPESLPPAYQRSFVHQQKRRAQLEDPNKDPIVSEWLAQVVQSGKWSKDAIISMNDPELASHAHRLSRPLDFSHDLDRPELDDFDLSKEEHAVYLV